MSSWGGRFGVPRLWVTRRSGNPRFPNENHLFPALPRVRQTAPRWEVSDGLVDFSTVRWSVFDGSWSDFDGPGRLSTATPQNFDGTTRISTDPPQNFDGILDGPMRLRRCRRGPPRVLDFVPADLSGLPAAPSRASAAPFAGILATSSGNCVDACAGGEFADQFRACLKSALLGESSGVVQSKSEWHNAKSAKEIQHWRAGSENFEAAFSTIGHGPVFRHRVWHTARRSRCS